MAFKNLIAFGAGELTPELYERGNLDKFRTGLARLRNAIVTKMGGLRSRAGSRLVFSPKSNNSAKYLYIQSRNYLFEFTNQNMRIRTGYNPKTFTFASSVDVSLALYPVADDVSNIHFTNGNRYIFIFREGYETIRIDLDDANLLTGGGITQLRNVVEPYRPSAWTTIPTLFNITASTTPAPNGYLIQYACTFIYQGVESFFFNTLGFNGGLKPSNTGAYNDLLVRMTLASLPAGVPFPDEARFYQRPNSAGAYLLIGIAYAELDATYAYYRFRDTGGAVVPTDQPPRYVDLFENDTRTASGFPGVYIYPPQGKTGLVYQDRLVFSGTRQGNRVFGTRTGTTTMTRDFPLQDDSAVASKLGSDGGLKVQRFFDGRGLLIFTTVGVYERPTALLTPETAYGIKRGPYVATDKIEPIQLGGFVTIYDERLRAVIGLTPSGNDQGYAYSEFGIFSSHLIKGKKPVSWALEDAETQVLWVVLDDGLVLSFSFQDEQHYFTDKAEEAEAQQVEEVQQA